MLLTRKFLRVVSHSHVEVMVFHHDVELLLGKACLGHLKLSLLLGLHEPQLLFPDCQAESLFSHVCW